LWPLYTAFDRLRRFSSPASLVCMLPLRFRASQSPLAASRLHQAPKSDRRSPLPVVSLLSARLGANFRSLRYFPSRLLSPSRVRAVDLSHSLAFDSLSPCEVDGILRYVCYPCLIQAESEPPGRRPPAPGSYIHRLLPSPVKLCGRAGRAALSATYRCFPRSRFHLPPERIWSYEPIR